MCNFVIPGSTKFLTFIHSTYPFMTKVTIGLVGKEGWAHNHVEKWFSQF